MNIKAVLPTICCLAAFAGHAHATTIDFTDLTDGPVGITLNLSPGVRLISSSSNPESANVILIVPKGLFAFPAGVNSVGALAALLEPPGESESGSGSISDVILLSVTPGAAGDGVSISFSSDTAGLNFSPVPNAILEDGTLQVVDGASLFPTPSPASRACPTPCPPASASAPSPMSP